MSAGAAAASLDSVCADLCGGSGSHACDVRV